MPAKSSEIFEDCELRHTSCRGETFHEFFVSPNCQDSDASPGKQIATVRGHILVDQQVARCLFAGELLLAAANCSLLRLARKERSQARRQEGEVGDPPAE